MNAFVSDAGTGGTIAGMGQFIEMLNLNVKVVLADPEGGGLYNKVKFGVMYDCKESEVVWSDNIKSARSSNGCAYFLFFSGLMLEFLVRDDHDRWARPSATYNMLENDGRWSEPGY